MIRFSEETFLQLIPFRALWGSSSLTPPEIANLLYCFYVTLFGLATAIKQKSVEY